MSAAQQQTLRVLHIEDDALIAQLVEIKLKWLSLPCQVTLAANREQFESALQQKDFDLVISDSQVPDLDTYDAMARIRAVRPGVPFIFLSGNRKPDAREEALRRGATDYVRKEHLSNLIHAIQRACPETAAAGPQPDASSDTVIGTTSQPIVPFY
jgi:CheY-like chemotaxis protein